jgi:aerobic-type carbon monoxide dehydrogenase small subunit (CoxS/CutS family)
MMTLKVNGHDHQIDADPDTPLLYVLRDDIKLNAAKFGCGLGQCGDRRRQRGPFLRDAAASAGG